jgi:toxin ParE1/3/4
MMSWIISAEALRDIDDIRDHSLRIWGGSQTRKYLGEIQAAIIRASNAPHRASLASEYRSGYRKTRTKSHMIFFKIGSGQIEVVRILHVHADFDAQLE